MKTNHTIDYFNYVSGEIFEFLSEIKYSVRLLEINEEKMFIGFSIDTEYFCAQITVLMPNNPKYMHNRACSMQLYSFDDTNLDLVLFEAIARSVEECTVSLIDQDVVNTIAHPKYYLN